MNLNKGCIEIIDVDDANQSEILMNLNKGCIEMQNGKIVTFPYRMNLNKGCIEIYNKDEYIKLLSEMNLNKGCIEMTYQLRKFIKYIR